jgi:hypothetical protein
MSKELTDKLLKASEMVHKASTKGGANYMVVSSDVANMIQGIYNQEKASWRKEKINKLFNE